MRARLSTTTGAASSLASGAVVREANDVDDDVERVFAGRNDYDYDDGKKKTSSSKSKGCLKNPWLLLFSGFLVGACLPVLMNHKSVRVAHTHVKGAYRHTTRRRRST